MSESFPRNEFFMQSSVQNTILRKEKGNSPYLFQNKTNKDGICIFFQLEEN